MTLMVVKAEDVREGEPRSWASDAETARRHLASGTVSVNDLHDTSRERLGLMSCEAAIVDRPEQPATPQSDTDERAFWTGIVRDLVPSAIAYVTPGRGDVLTDHAEEAATRCATYADAALSEYRKRWGAR